MVPECASAAKGPQPATDWHTPRFPFPKAGGSSCTPPLGGRDSGVGIIIEGAQPVSLSEVIAGAYGLTPREREITARAAQGRSTKQIASALGISPFTVQDHLKAVFAKADVQSRAELVAERVVPGLRVCRDRFAHQARGTRASPRAAHILRTA